MNIERLRAVRDAILNPPEGCTFDMNAWVEVNHDCGTAGCIAGFAALMFLPPGVAVKNEWTIPEAGGLLGLTHRQAFELFMPAGDGLDYETVTPAQAAATIDRLIETGKVVWVQP